MLNQIMRASKFNVKFKALQAKIDNRISELQHVIGILCSSVKAEDIRTSIDGVQSTIGEVQSTHLAQCPSSRQLRVKFFYRDERQAEKK